MSLADDLSLDQPVWADLTTAQKCDAVAHQLVKGRNAEEAAALLSVTYGPIGVNHVRGVADRHKLYDRPDVQAARAARSRAELAAAASRVRARAPGLRLVPSLPKLPPVKLGNPRKKKNITVFDLKPHSCRRPLWDGKETDVFQKFYCGQRAQEGESYCPACAELIYAQPEPDQGEGA